MGIGVDPTNVDSLTTFELTSSTSDDAAWVSGWFAYGGMGAEKSCVIYFEMPPGKRLGRHTDTAEEMQIFISGRGELLLDSGPKPVRPGDVVVLTEGTFHDLRNTGTEDLRVIAVFSAPKVEQHWSEEVWQPGDLKITASPNS